MSIANWVKMTVLTAPGTGIITLGSAVSGHITFTDGFPGVTTQEVFYTITDGENRENGVGTFTASGTTLSRDTILETLNAGVFDNTSPAALNLTANAQVSISPSTYNATKYERVYRDLEGIYIPATGAAAPAVSTFKTVNAINISARNYGVGDASNWEFHMPHDWAKGTNLFIHVHWGHNGTAISGTMTWDFAATFAPRTVASGGGDTFADDAFGSISTGSLSIGSFPQYSHVVEEVSFSNSGGTGNLLDTDNLTVDGKIILRVQPSAIPTISGGTNQPFLFGVDLHYLTDLVGTPSKDPNFYAW